MSGREGIGPRIGDSIHRQAEGLLPPFDPFAGTIIGWSYLEAVADLEKLEVAVNFVGKIEAQINDTTFLVTERVHTIRVSTGLESSTETKIMNLSQLRDGIFFKSGHAMEQHMTLLKWQVRDARRKLEEEVKDK